MRNDKNIKKPQINSISNYLTLKDHISNVQKKRMPRNESNTTPFPEGTKQHVSDKIRNQHKNFNTCQGNHHSTGALTVNEIKGSSWAAMSIICI
jgi:hypothetical protein